MNRAYRDAQRPANRSIPLSGEFLFHPGGMNKWDILLFNKNQNVPLFRPVGCGVPCPRLGVGMEGNGKSLTVFTGILFCLNVA